MLAKAEVARFVAGVLPVVLKEHGSAMHRALIAFHAGTLLEYIAKVKNLDENLIAFLLPAAMDPLQAASAPDANVKPALLQETIVCAVDANRTALSDPLLLVGELPRPRCHGSKSTPDPQSCEVAVDHGYGVRRARIAEAARTHACFNMCSPGPIGEITQQCRQDTDCNTVRRPLSYDIALAS